MHHCWHPIDLIKSIYISVANDAIIAVWVMRGHRPDLKAIPSDAPTELVDIIKKCWVGDPNERPNFRGNKDMTMNVKKILKLSKILN